VDTLFVNGAVFDGTTYRGVLDVGVRDGRIVAVDSPNAVDDSFEAAEYQARIKQYADHHPGLPWILGGGWHQPDFPGGTPQAVDLDRLTGGRPGSAYVNHADHTGRIAPGARADLVVLDRDPFQNPPDEIAAARVRATYVDGHPVYRR
jgi:predicted amidohydrolase YtcJ